MENKLLESESFLEIQSALDISAKDEDVNVEEDMIIQIERRIAEMMEKEMDLLLSYLYRLDIAEHKINACLNQGSSVHPYTCLANLIWERQKERIETKKKFSSKDQVEDGWEW